VKRAGRAAAKRGRESDAGPPGHNGAPNPKTYDRAYFDRWYRDPREAVIHRDVLARRVQLALSAAEYILEHPVTSVLDVGCGEAPWRALVRMARPGASYVGVDSSEYAVRRFGRRRNIRLGRFGDLGRMKLGGPFDLIVCSDVLHYVPTPEARRGLRAIARLLGGLAFIEFFSKEDDTIGDDEGYVPRPESAYRNLFREAGLVHLGLHCYASRRDAVNLMTFEKGKE
jgi:SAM-dependent methyltransferase